MEKAPALQWQRSRIRSTVKDSPARKHKPDYALLVIALVMLVIGLIVVYSIGPGLAAIKQVSENYYVQRQAIAIVLSIASFIAAASIPPSTWRRFVRPLIILSVVSAIAVALFGEKINGASRWVQVGGLSFQSAELIKFTLIIALADFLSRRREQRLINDTYKTLAYLLFAIFFIGVVVAGVQSDLGSAAVMVFTLVTMSILAGLPLKRMVTVGMVIAVGLTIAVASTPYRRDRVATFLHPTADCQGAGYQSCQALIAIGSGGMFGKGLGNSVQAYGYLPEAANDSIFAIYAEKFGFLGTAILIVLYGVLFARLKRIVDHISDDFQKFVVIGLLAWLSSQTIVNIGAMLGLLPLKGITLPFISYGGTSLLFVMAALGLAFAISRYTAYAPVPLEIGDADNNKNIYGGQYDDHTRRRRIRRAHHTQLSRRTLR